VTEGPRRPRLYDIEDAKEVAADLRAHEQLCTERWNELRKSVDKMDAKIDKFFWAMLACAVSVIGTLLLQLLKMKGG
jgi:hypothetical protein